MIMASSLGLMGACLAETQPRSTGTSDRVSTSQLLVAGGLMVGAWKYPSWIVETPPATLALPLLISMYFYFSKTASSPIQGCSLVIGCALTKVVSIVPFAALISWFMPLL